MFSPSRWSVSLQGLRIPDVLDFRLVSSHHNESKSDVSRHNARHTLLPIFPGLGFVTCIPWGLVEVG